MSPLIERLPSVEGGESRDADVPPDPSAPLVRSRLERTAVASFVLGLLALPLNIFAGLPAILLGYRSLYAINAGEGQLRGRALAVSGMLLGLAGCLLALVFGLFLLFGRLGEANARTDCANNLRQLGAGLERYQEFHQKTYPTATIANPLLQPDERLSWLTALLPFLERKATPRAKWQALVDSIDPDEGWQAPANQAAAGTRISTFLCRGQPDANVRATPGLTDYVGLAGVGPDAPSLPAGDPQAGFFGYDRLVTRPQMADHLAYTMMATETTWANGPWIAGGLPTVRGVVPEQAPLIGTGRPFGGTHFSFTGVPGLNTLWLDGSVRYFTDALPPEMFAGQTRLRR